MSLDAHTKRLKRKNCSNWYNLDRAPHSQHNLSLRVTFAFPADRIGISGTSRKFNQRHLADSLFTTRRMRRRVCLSVSMLCVTLSSETANLVTNNRCWFLVSIGFRNYNAIWPRVHAELRVDEVRCWHVDSIVPIRAWVKDLAKHKIVRSPPRNRHVVNSLRSFTRTCTFNRSFHHRREGFTRLIGISPCMYWLIVKFSIIVFHK